MRRNSYKEKSKSDYKVVKKCAECEKEIPVACKTCPLCKSPVVSAKAQKNKSDEEVREGDARIRRTERVRRERPDFFNAMEVDNKFKKKRRRKESVETKASSSTADDDKATDDGEMPKKKRGRPKSVTTLESIDKNSESKSPPPEEDWYAHLPPEKFMQYKIILAEINRKTSTQNFNPV